MIPRWRVPRPATIDDLFNVIREVRIEDRGVSGFFFVFLCKRDAFGDGTPLRLCRMQNRYGPGVFFDDYFGAGADAGHQRGEVACGVFFGDVDYALDHKWIIHCYSGRKDARCYVGHEVARYAAARRLFLALEGVAGS